jgi:adenosylhomocysteine nucleosidase
MIAVFCAMEEEVKELKRQMTVENVYRYKASRIYEGMFHSKKVLLVQTGVGKQKALEAAEYVLDKFSVNAVISCGFGGALVDSLGIGDVVYYSSICTSEGKEESVGLAAFTAPVYQKVIQQARSSSKNGFRYLYGKGVTTGEICATQAARGQLYREYLATVVDMESYWIARAVLNLGIQCIVVRSISDLVCDDLTFLNSVFSHGRISLRKLAGCLVRRPDVLRNLVNLYRNSRSARKNLTIAIKDLITGCLGER